MLNHKQLLTRILYALLLILIFLFPVLNGCHKKIDANTTIDKKAELPLRVMIISDPHYLSPDLFEEGNTFRTMMANSDGKITDYSRPLMEQLINKAVEHNIDAVIISGDLTFNGERKSHQELAELLQNLITHGIPVLVLPGNHDIDNFFAYQYKKDTVITTQTISANLPGFWIFWRHLLR